MSAIKEMAPPSREDGATTVADIVTSLAAAQFGTTPLSPTLMRPVSNVPSGFLVAATMLMAAPGLSTLASLIWYWTIGVLGVTMIFFSPPLYLTITAKPSTPVTGLPASPFVMVPLGAPGQPSR